MGIWNDLFTRVEPELIEKVDLTAIETNEAANRLDSIVNTLSGLGTIGDVGVTARPNVNPQRLSDLELESLYRNNGYAQRIVDIFPDEATRKGWRVIDPSQKIDPMSDENDRLSVFKKFRTAMIQARMKGGALILPTIEMTSGNSGNPESLATPLDMKKIKQVINLHVFEEREFKAIEYGTDPTKPQYREPTMWHVTPEGALGMKVHWSRAIYIPGVEVTNRVRMQQNGIDDSVLQACWDAIRNLTSIDQGGATLAQRLAMNVLKVTGLRNMETGKQEAFFRARMKVIASGLSLLNTVLLGEGDEFDVRATPVAGFKDLSQSAKEALSASSGIPLAILFGEAPGGLSTDGESHRRAFNNAVAAFQEEILREPLNRLYAILFNARLGPAKGNEPENWKLEFLPLEELSEIQEAELRLKHAQRDMMYLQWGVLDGPHVAKSRFGETGYSSEILPIEEADIEDKQLANMIKEALKEADASAADQGSNATIEGEKP